jgi:signal transduction histidine kinase
MSLVTEQAPAVRQDEDRTREALDFIHGLMRAPKSDWAMPELLERMAQAFGARCAGIAAPGSVLAVSDGRPDNSRGFPWENDPELQARLRTSATAISIPGDDASWLVAGIWPQETDGRLLWLTADADREWSEGERAALPLLGLGLVRLAGGQAERVRWTRTLERAQLQRHVEQAAQVTGRLAHDFGNVLTGIMGFAELSLAHLPAESLPRRYVREVIQSAEHGAAWLRKLQLFSRRGRREFQPAHLAPVVGEEEARLREAWAGRVSFLLALPEGLPRVAVDAESLRQMLAQLLDNAGEAISGRGVVTLSAHPRLLDDSDCLDLVGNCGPGSVLEITVTDTGCGMSPQTQRRLFTELFFSTKPRHRGLGLAVVYGFLQRFRGGLRLGPGPEQGTAVRLYLPTEPGETVQPVQSTSETADILVVDDDPMVLELLCQVLSKAGHRVRGASSPNEALQLYTHGAYQLVVADVMMPVMDGFDMARKLRGLDPAAKFLFITSQACQGPPADDMVGAFPVLKKPFALEALVGAVAAALGHAL